MTMPPGRPALRIGQHGRITRSDLGGNSWVARCRYRDTDGVTRVVERRTPPGTKDQYGAVAEKTLLDALDSRRPPGAGEITSMSVVAELLARHLDRLRDEAELSPKSIETYSDTIKAVRKRFVGIRVHEATPGLLSEILRGIQRDHGDTRARHTRGLLKAVFTDCVLAGAIDANPVLQLGRQKRRTPAKGAPAVDQDAMIRAYKRVTTSGYCRRTDLRDLVLFLMGTGARISETLGVRWTDVDLDAAEVTFAGRVMRVTGVGLIRQEGLKNHAPSRTVALPPFLVAALKHRRETAASDTWVFPSTTGGLRDVNNCSKQWRQVRDRFGLTGVSSHSWRRTAATVIDEAGLSARVGADQLGHTRASMTADVYWRRNGVHSEAAQAIEAVVTRRLSDENKRNRPTSGQTKTDASER
ncbi:tyrosine-type recombinase/integrase [Gordonia sp. ABSL11-1]|uniref:tyrosine-type recombinase/integrase n=1 Tax=Gordonia sp. ABSL11-1 TaxID=3053924 RepID=UPI002573C1A2|nr:site-specific integrase [Gordonia sp. ABSL11-1]MDL9944268.1 tyrosine-type recombinase/integrase [Gordonia sp. ABSL11-1]